MILVVSSSYHRFRRYCREAGLNANDSSKVRCVTMLSDMRGYRGVEVRFLPDWHKGLSSEEMQVMADYARVIEAS